MAGTGLELDASKWETFIRGLDRESTVEFRKGFRRSARELQKAIRGDWSGGRLQRRTGKSAKSIGLRVPSVRGLMSGKAIEGKVASKRFTVRLHETGYAFRRKRGGPTIKHIPGQHIFQTRTEAHSKRHRKIMEDTMRDLIRKVTRQ